MPVKTRGMKTETVYYGDCLRNMERWIDWNRWNEPVLADLIYADPPWNSNANYNILFDKGEKAQTGHTAQVAVFEDIWVWNAAASKRVENILSAENKYHPARNFIEATRMLIGDCGMLSYLSFMAERLTLCKLLLKETGSIYLHCDPYANYYLRLLLDEIFGRENLLSEIIWNYGTPSGGRVAGKKPVKAHDVLLSYTKNYSKHTYNRQYLPYSEKYVKDWFRHTDESGRKYQTRSRKGKIVRQYLDESPGVPLSNVWSDIMQLYGQAGWFAKLGSDERQGYPTQKPLALLERIIKASSNEGDLVLDPFCGCGTSVVAAQDLGRKFVGIDVSLFSVKSVVLERLRGKCEIGGIPEDLASWKQLEKEDCYAFEALAVEQSCDAGMKANLAQSGDGGVDGYGRLLNDCAGKDLVVAQVKSSRKGRKPSLGMVRDFAQAMRMEDAVAGIFITMRRRDWTDGMERVAESMGKFQVDGSATEYPRMQHWSVEQYFENKKYNRFAYLPDLANPLKRRKEPFQFQKEPLFRRK